ncbi:MAG: AbrB/MazE/SpoVT family DNA-binding domain-containing protein [Rhodothermales bacterium]|nr:AbrB/MazE/SpoVT family DNA-binding domain-containing protein [Rhodothermales bacterium]
MSKLSSKRQITLPVEHCTELGIEPGDDLEFFVANGYLTAVKKKPEAAKGILRGLKADKSMTDEESRQSAIRR